LGYNDKLSLEETPISSFEEEMYRSMTFQIVPFKPTATTNWYSNILHLYDIHLLIKRENNSEKFDV
jgi:hypothetical protein